VKKGVSTGYYIYGGYKTAFDTAGCAVCTFKWPIMCSVVFMSHDNMIGSLQGWPTGCLYAFSRPGLRASRTASVSSWGTNASWKVRKLGELMKGRREGRKRHET